MNSVKIAIVRALDGHLTCVGPNDFQAGEYSDQMNAAMGWHLEAGHLPCDTFWIEAELPPIPTVPELRAKAEAGEFPKSFVAEMDDGFEREPQV